MPAAAILENPVDQPTKQQLLERGLSPMWRPYHQDDRHGLHLPGEEHTVHVYGVGSAWTAEVRRGTRVVATQDFQILGVPFEAMVWGQEKRAEIEDPGEPEEFGHHKEDGD